jgi:hypothetical protein
MSHKKFRFKIEKVEGKTVKFYFPNHVALMNTNKGKNLFNPDEPTAVSVFVGSEFNYRINWKLRCSLTTDDRAEFTLYDSKERKQVSVFVDLVSLIKGLILEKEHTLEDEDYRIWE